MWILLTAKVGAADLRYVDPQAGAGKSAAVIVPEEAVLLHTAQFLPVDTKGTIVGKGEPARQTEKLFDDLANLLKENNSSLDRLVKVNLGVANQGAVAEVIQVLARRFRDRPKPAVTVVVGALPHPDALVAVDAVAALGDDARAFLNVKLARSDSLPNLGHGQHLAHMPAGTRIYVSGQAEKGDLATATRRTLESLRATLKFLDADDNQVVQVKSFLNPMADVGAVKKEIARFYGARVPPQVFVEWKSTLPIEIELIAWGGLKKAGPPIEYLTPPGMKASPVYSRVARINHGPVIYFSSLHAAQGPSPEAEIPEIFDTLGGLLRKTGSDFRHLAKATYYVTTAEAVKHMGKIRPRYYDPQRPPAASLAIVPGTGQAGKTVTLDMIAVPAAKP